MKDQKYNELINRIKAIRPELDDPQMLISEILVAVGKTSPPSVTNRYLKLISWVSTIAAVMLIGLFLFERSAPAIYPASKTSVSNYNPYPLTGIDTDNISTSDIIDNIVREKREHKRKQASFRMSIVNKYQILNQI